jgi:hypothetical protein
MKRQAEKLAREEVLDAFAVEPDADGATLERYLRDYPEYAASLVDLSRERSRFVRENKEPLTAEDEAKTNEAWEKYVEYAQKIVADPLAALSVEKLRTIAARLDVPRQIVTAFRERRVDVASVPRRFLARFAEAVDTTVEAFTSALTISSGQSFARSYKAVDRPRAAAAVTFEQLLIEAGISEEKRAALMADDE